MISFYGQAKTDSSRPIARGSKLTFEPWLERGRLNPPSAVLDWQEPVHRVEFRFLLPSDVDGATVRGGVRVFSGVLLVGELQFSVTVTSDAPLAGGPSIETHAAMYRKIFASYSHQDIDVVESLIAHVEAIGDRYLIDVRDLRAGEVWSDPLAEMIRAADIFQLFWLTTLCDQPSCATSGSTTVSIENESIRPVHWEFPLPEDPEHGLPPVSLRKLQFAALHLQLDSDTDYGKLSPRESRRLRRMIADAQHEADRERNTSMALRVFGFEDIARLEAQRKRRQSAVLLFWVLIIIIIATAIALLIIMLH